MATHLGLTIAINMVFAAIILVVMPLGLYLSLGSFVALILATYYKQYTEHKQKTQAPGWTYVFTFLMDALFWVPAIIRQVLSKIHEEAT